MWNIIWIEILQWFPKRKFHHPPTFHFCIPLWTVNFNFHYFCVVNIKLQCCRFILIVFLVPLLILHMYKVTMHYDESKVNEVIVLICIWFIFIFFSLIFFSLRIRSWLKQWATTMNVNFHHFNIAEIKL